MRSLFVFASLTSEVLNTSFPLPYFSPATSRTEGPASASSPSPPPLRHERELGEILSTAMRRLLRSGGLLRAIAEKSSAAAADSPLLVPTGRGAAAGGLEEGDDGPPSSRENTLSPVSPSSPSSSSVRLSRTMLSSGPDNGTAAATALNGSNNGNAAENGNGHNAAEATTTGMYARANLSRIPHGTWSGWSQEMGHFCIF